MDLDTDTDTDYSLSVLGAFAGAALYTDVEPADDIPEPIAPIDTRTPNERRVQELFELRVVLAQELKDAEGTADYHPLKREWNALEGAIRNANIALFRERKKVTVIVGANTHKCGTCGGRLNAGTATTTAVRK